MATRPNKTGGNDNYVAEVAAGQTTIRASEVDGDLNEIYSNIDNGNLSPAAGIAYTKLALTNKIATTDIKNFNVTVGKIAIGATTNNFQSGAVLANLNINDGEGVISTISTFTPRGGRVILFGKPALTVSVNGVGGVNLATIRLYRNSAGAGFILQRSWDFPISFQTGGGAADSVTYPLPLPEYHDVPATVTQIYEWRGFSPAASSVFIKTPAANTGITYAIELS